MINETIYPSSVDIEKSIIGAILTNQSYYDLVSSILKHEHFYDEANAVVYKSFQDLISESTPIDPLTVSIELRKKNSLELVGGSYGLMKLTNSISTEANIEAHSAIVVEKYLLRECIYFANELMNRANSKSTVCFDLIDWAGSKINIMVNVVENKQAKRRDEVSGEVLSDCFKTLNEGISQGVPISISKLQEKTNGWRKGNLIILAARPAMGKTAVALDYAYYPVANGIPVGFFSLEMTAKELAGRLMSKESGISSQKINTNLVDTFELTQLRKDCLMFKDLPLYIDDTPSLSITRLRSKALRMKREFGIELIIVDYLQLMDGANNSDNREQEISKISRGLKKLAKELDIPIIALSQLSREVEKRPSKKPQLSDLRDSGSIEQDADMVIFILRPEYYEHDTYLFGNEEVSSNGLMVHILAKFRGGMTGEIRNRWISETTSIANW